MNINTIALISAALVHTSNSFAIQPVIGAETKDPSFVSNLPPRLIGGPIFVKEKRRFTASTKDSSLPPSSDSTLPADWFKSSTTIESNSISGNSNGTLSTTVAGNSDSTITTTIQNLADTASSKIADAINSTSTTIADNSISGNSNGTLSTTVAGNSDSTITTTIQNLADTVSSKIADAINSTSTTIADNSISGNSTFGISGTTAGHYNGTLSTTIQNLADDTTPSKITDVMNTVINSVSTTITDKITDNSTIPFNDSTTTATGTPNLLNVLVMSVTGVFSTPVLVGLTLGFFVLVFAIISYAAYRCMCKKE